METSMGVFCHAKFDSFAGGYAEFHSKSQKGIETAFQLLVQLNLKISILDTKSRCIKPRTFGCFCLNKFLHIPHLDGSS